MYYYKKIFCTFLFLIKWRSRVELNDGFFWFPLAYMVHRYGP